MGNLPSITTESGLRFQSALNRTELDRIDRRVGGELTLTDVHRHCQIPEDNPFLSRMFEMYSDGHGYITTHQMQSLLAKLSRLGPDKIGQLQCEYIYAVTYKTVFMSPITRHTDFFTAHTTLSPLHPSPSPILLSLSLSLSLSSLLQLHSVF
jgi:hypothetical protein